MPIVPPSFKTFCKFNEWYSENALPFTKYADLLTICNVTNTFLLLNAKVIVCFYKIVKIAICRIFGEHDVACIFAVSLPAARDSRVTYIPEIY